MSDDITQTQIDLLNLLKDHGQHFSSIRVIADRLSLTVNQVNQSLRELLRWGYRFETSRRGEIRFKTIPDILFAHEIQRGLKARVLGKDIRCFRSVCSSNSVAQRCALRGVEEGTVIIAGRQTAGRGRLGRSWVSPAKVGVYLSVVLRPAIPPMQAPGLSLVAALAVTETIREYPGLPAQIKWPNDVVIGDKKVAGVLTELSAEVDRVNFVVVGIGLNANHGARDFPGELVDKATSLRIEQGCHVNRVRLVQGVLAHLEKRYHQYLKSGLAEQLDLIRSYSSIMSKQVCFLHGSRSQSGVVVDIAGDGSLLVKVGKQVLSLSSGEVTLAESYSR